MTTAATWKDVECATQPTLCVKFEQGNSWADFTRFSWIGWIDPADTGYSTKLYETRELRLDYTYCLDKENLGEGQWQAQMQWGSNLTLETAEGTVRVLRRVQNGIVRIEKRDGQTRSFGQFLARVCRVLGVKKMAIESDSRGGISWGELGEMADLIDYRVSQHRRTVAEKQAA